MGAVPSTTNSKAAFFQGMVNAGVEGGEKGVEAYLTAQFPLLANPFLHVILNYFVEYFGKDLEEILDPMVAAAVIDIQTHQEKSQVYQALLALSKNTGGTNENANSDNAWGNLIRWDGSSRGPTP